MKEIERVTLVCADVGHNNNKQYRVILFENGSIEVEFGRIGGSMARQSKSGGKRVFDSLIAKKLKGRNGQPGYTVAKIVEDKPSDVILSAGVSLKDIALSQIIHDDEKSAKLIEDLVDYNIHQISSRTQISYDSISGLFQTPVGVLTAEAITEARGYLSKIKSPESRDDLIRNVNTYLRLVPQKVGRKLDPDLLFGSQEKLQAQNDLLDSLASSLDMLKQGRVKPKAVTDIEEVFNLTVDYVEEAAVIDRIIRLFNQTRNSHHTSSRLKVKAVYEVRNPSLESRFSGTLGKIGGNMELWHGTKKVNLLSILKSGLKISPPSTANITGKMFGNGLYFSDQSTKSLNYAHGYWDGKYEKDCFMFLVDVAMGKWYTPPRPCSKPPSGYDSVFAKGGQSGVQNNEMIVYSESQFNLKYLIHFSE